jgi:hypothetical protein
MWQSYECPFGCEAKHVETLASEAMAYWYGVHRKVCVKVERDSDG